MKFQTSLAAIAAVFAFPAATFVAMPASAEVVVARNGQCADINGSGDWPAVLANCKGNETQNVFNSNGVQRYQNRCMTTRGDNIIFAPCGNGAAERWSISSDGKWRNAAGQCASLVVYNGINYLKALSCNSATTFALGAKSVVIKGATGAFNSQNKAIPSGGLISQGATLIGQDGNSFKVTAGSLVSIGGGNLVSPGGGN